MKRRGFFAAIAGALGFAKFGAPEPAEAWHDQRVYDPPYPGRLDFSGDRYARRYGEKNAKYDKVECPSCKKMLEFAHIENRVDPYLDFWCGSCAVWFRDE